MKRQELRIRRNYHVSKRITSRIEREYGVTIERPFACDTVPALIASSRQQLRKTPETRSPPVTRYGVEPRGPSNQSRREFLSAFACLSDADVNEWAEDDYLALQLGPHASGRQKNTSTHNRHPDCDEPECGSFDWYCDLCQEVSTTDRIETTPVHDPPVILEEQRAITSEPPCERALSISQFIAICPVVAAIRRYRQSKVSSELEDYYESALFDIQEDCTIVQESSSHPASISSLSDHHVDRVEVPSIQSLQNENLPMIDRNKIILSYLLSVGDVYPPSLPGVDFYKVLSITREQGFVFDRGKSCSCGLWITKASTAIAC